MEVCQEVFPRVAWRKLAVAAILLQQQQSVSLPPPSVEMDCLVLCCSLATVILQSSQCMCAHVVPKIALDPCRNCLRNPPPLFCGRKWVLDTNRQNRIFRFCLPSVSQHVCICLNSARKVSTSANSSASSPEMFARGRLPPFSQLNSGGGEPTLRSRQAHLDRR